MALFNRKKGKKSKQGGGEEGDSSAEMQITLEEKDIQEGLYEEVNNTAAAEVDHTKKRRFLRYDAANSLWYSVADSEFPLKEVGITKMIALGGLGMQTFNPIDKGRKLKMEIVMDDDRHINITSEVVYCIPLGDGTFDVGVQFVRILGEDLVYLKSKYPPKPDK